MNKKLEAAYTLNAKKQNKLKSGRITQVQTYLSKQLNFYAIVVNLLPLHWFYCNLNMAANT